MSDLSNLYQDVILDHSKRPRNFHPIPDADHHANGYNPLCGDKVTIYYQMVARRAAGALKQEALARLEKLSPPKK